MPPTQPPDNTPAPANSAKKSRDSFQRYDTSLMAEDWKLGYQLAEQEALMMLRRLTAQALQNKHDSEPMSSDTPEGLRMTQLGNETKVAIPRQSDRIVEENNASVGGNKEMRLWLGVYRSKESLAELREQRDFLCAQLERLHKSIMFLSSVYSIGGIVAFLVALYCIVAFVDLAWVSISALYSEIQFSYLGVIVERFGLALLFIPYLYWYFRYEKRVLSEIESVTFRLAAVRMVLAERGDTVYGF